LNIYKLLYFKVQHIQMAYSADFIATQHKPMAAMVNTSNNRTHISFTIRAYCTFVILIYL